MPRNSPPSLSEILEGQVYLGNLSAALSVEQRQKYSITHILSVCPEYPSTGNTENHLNISIEDSEYEDLLIHLPTTCRFIEDAIEQGGRVLVHCVMGISRSPAVVAAFLMKTKGMMAPEAITFVKQKRPQVHLNYGFAKQLDTFRKCGFDPSPENAVYRSWKRRNEQDVTAFLNHIVDTVSIIPDKLLLSSEFPSDPDKTWSLLMDLGVTHLLSISPTEISTTADSIANHHHINIDSRSPDALLFALPDICAYINDAIKNGGLVLVHSMIESRACTGVCAYLMSASGYTPAEAFSAINKALPLFNPTRSFFRNLELFEECGYMSKTTDAVSTSSEPAVMSQSNSSKKDDKLSDAPNSPASGWYNESRYDLDNFGNTHSIQSSSQSPIRVL